MRMLLSTTIVVLSIGLATTTSGQTAPNGGTNTAIGQSSGSVMTQNPESHWIASGFAGSNFGMNADPGSGTFGGSVGYLWKSKVGAEIETGFTPSFQHQSSFFGLGLTPDVNDYMGNIIGAIPLGADGAWQPYVSGGVGAISLRSGDLRDTAGNALNLNSSRFGGNVGGGVMAFVGHLGFKGDVRYYRASGAYQTSSSSAVAGAASTPSASPSPSPTPSPSPSPSPTPSPSPGPGPYITAVQTGTPVVVSSGTDTTTLGNNLLAGLAYWRANFGVAFRW